MRVFKFFEMVKNKWLCTQTTLLNSVQIYSNGLNLIILCLHCNCIGKCSNAFKYLLSNIWLSVLYISIFWYWIIWCLFCLIILKEFILTIRFLSLNNSIFILIRECWNSLDKLHLDYLTSVNIEFYKRMFIITWTMPTWLWATEWPITVSRV